MTKVFMVGPTSTGGVATHTKNIIKYLKKQGTVVQFYHIEGFTFKKIYQRTIGLFLNSIYNCREYDLIHIQSSGGISSFCAAVSGVISGKMLQKPIVITFHYSKTQYFVKKHPLIFRYVLSNCNKMILVSHKQEEVVKSAFPNLSEKIVVLPNGFSDSQYYYIEKEKCRSQLNLPQNKKIIFNISNLIESKGHKYLISAMENVISSDENCMCYIAGSGYFENDLNTHTKNLNLQNYVKFIGWIPTDLIPIWINACDIFVLPSLAEGNPIVMFETLACGKPFLGTDIGGMPEIIKSSDHGLISEHANHSKLAQTILIALNKEWDKDKILEYSKQFTWENISKETGDVYMDICES